MKKTILILFAALFVAASVKSQSIYKVDPAHASVNFRVKHMGITFVAGKFDKFDGGIIGSFDNFDDARVFFNVDVASINTGVGMRDDHLRSADFFEVESFPSMSFESTGIEKLDDNQYKLKGKLQIKDVTKDVVFDVKYGGLVKGDNGSETLGFIATKSINRLDYNVAGDPEGSSIGTNVEITLYLEFKKSE